MLIYISGPISGIIDRNKKVFQKAEREISSVFKSIKVDKLKIINPVKLGYKLDALYCAFGKKPEWADYMRICIEKLCKADFVYLLPGWGISEGALMEKYIATRLGIPCVENIKELSKLIIGGHK